MGELAFKNEEEISGGFDAGWCVVKGALETAISFLGEERVEEILESGSEERILELVYVFTWLNLLRERALLAWIGDIKVCHWHWRSEHFLAAEFFLREDGWLDFLPSDA